MNITASQIPDCAYGISSGLLAKVRRRLTPYLARRELSVKLAQPIISITFDDFPKSVMEYALPLLNERGWKATFYVAAGLENTINYQGLHFNREDLLLLQDQGHEIACHTYNHVNINKLSAEQVKNEILQNAKALKDMGITQSLYNFAYPYGEVTPTHKTLLAKHFRSMRGIIPNIDTIKVDLNQLSSVPLYSGSSFQPALNYINNITQTGGYLSLFTHDVRPTPSTWGITAKDFKTAIKTIDKVMDNSNITIATVNEALTILEEQNSANG